MAITRQKKEELIKQYVQDLKEANNLVVFKQSWIPVVDATKIRKSVLASWGKFNVIRKKLFLRALDETGYESTDASNLAWSVVALYASNDEYAPLKTINWFLKAYEKDKKNSSFSYLWWWFDKKWYNWEYVSDLANIPSKDELLSKLVYLLNYPLQSFAVVLDQISKKVESGIPTDSGQAEQVETKVEIPAAELNAGMTEQEEVKVESEKEQVENKIEEVKEEVVEDTTEEKKSD